MIYACFIWSSLFRLGKSDGLFARFAYRTGWWANVSGAKKKIKKNKQHTTYVNQGSNISASQGKNYVLVKLNLLQSANFPSQPARPASS